MVSSNDGSEPTLSFAPDFPINTVDRMSIRIFSAAFLWLLLCGCQSTGDFGAVFVQQVSYFGGHAQTTNTVPELRGTWSMKSDAEGFQAHLSGVPFAHVQSFMQQVYGSPVFVATNAMGQPHGLYKALDIGVAIQFFGETNGVGFICLRAQKR
jgi:hypothetical protein